MGIALVLQLVNGLLGLASFALAIIVLIKLYNAEGAGQMLLGLFCGLYLFIWGWQNAARLGFAKEMKAWKLCLLAQLVVMVLFVVAGTLAA